MSHSCKKTRRVSPSLERDPREHAKYGLLLLLLLVAGCSAAVESSPEQGTLCAGETVTVDCSSKPCAFADEHGQWSIATSARVGTPCEFAELDANAAPHIVYGEAAR